MMATLALVPATSDLVTEHSSRDLMPGPARLGPAASGPAAEPAGQNWWNSWLSRFGLAECCGTAGAAAGFAIGYLPGQSLLAAAGLATTLEVIGFYSCVGVRTAWQARLVTAHLSGWQRLAAAGWHAISEHFASCLVAEILDDFLIRPLAVAGAAGLMRPLPGGIWLGLLAGKLAADVAWYAMEASARSAAARRGGRS
jgi:hypothetical protein